MSNAPRQLKAVKATGPCRVHNTLLSTPCAKYPLQVRVYLELDIPVCHQTGQLLWPARLALKRKVDPHNTTLL